MFEHLVVTFGLPRRAGYDFDRKRLLKKMWMLGSGLNPRFH